MSHSVSAPVLSSVAVVLYAGRTAGFVVEDARFNCFNEFSIEVVVEALLPALGPALVEVVLPEIIAGFLQLRHEYPECQAIAICYLPG